MQHNRGDMPIMASSGPLSIGMIKRCCRGAEVSDQVRSFTALNPNSSDILDPIIQEYNLKLGERGCRAEGQHNDR